MSLSGGRIWAVLLVAFLVPACGVGGGGTLTPTTAPAIPSAVTAAAGNRRVTITWQSSFTGSTFTVKRSLTSGGPYFALPGPGATPTSFIDTGLSNGTSYFYVVSASNQFGASADSVEVKATPGFKPLAIASGISQHSLAILPDRTVWSWGSNHAGQLGNGTFPGQSGVPVQVVDLNDATAIAAGFSHSLALRSDGTVWAWGADDGQLGLGPPTNVSLPRPAQVPALAGVVALAAGQYHSIALRSDGSVWTWGENTYGQIGNGTTGVPVPTPFQVPGLAGIKAIAGGSFHTLAIRQDGTVWAWGTNQFGELGFGPSMDISVPTQIPNLTAITAVAGGYYHSQALNSNGDMFAWGWNQSGQIGIAPTGGIVLPPVRLPLAEVISISAGDAGGLALRSDGTVWGWGVVHRGDGTPASVQTSPVQMSGVANATAIASGGRHYMVLDVFGTLRVWGSNYAGQVGDGSGEIRDVAAPVLNLTDVTAVSAGASTTHALRSDGTVWGFGANDRGQLGVGSTAPQPSAPTRVPNLTGVTAVSCGKWHVLTLRTDGTVWAWGENASGELGRGAFSVAPGTSPARVLVLTNILALSAAGNHSLAVRGDGTVWSWGANFEGQLGNGGTTSSHSPAQVSGLTGVIQVSAGSNFSLALRNDGTVRAWGYNSGGQLGTGTVSAVPVTSPVQVLNLTGIVAIAAGESHGLALDGNGVAWAWGSNHYGELGNGSVSVTPVATPIQVVNLSGVTGLSAGLDHSLALKADGTVWGWGRNRNGQLGSGNEADSPSPVQAVGLTNATAISAGFFHGAALRTDGMIWTWGGNNFGQLGTPVVREVLVPVSITQ